MQSFMEAAIDLREIESPILDDPQFLGDQYEIVGCPSYILSRYPVACGKCSLVMSANACNPFCAVNFSQLSFYDFDVRGLIFDQKGIVRQLNTLGKGGFSDFRSESSCAINCIRVYDAKSTRPPI